MKIIQATQNEFDEWLALTFKLWPDDELEERQALLTEILRSPHQAGFIAQDAAGRAIAFMHLGLRYDYVPGASRSPVAYLEGIYVDEEYRHQGIATQLVQFAEQWAIAQGCVELASDALIENTASHAFHMKVGFQEVERIVTFIQRVVE